MEFHKGQVVVTTDRPGAWSKEDVGKKGIVIGFEAFGNIIVKMCEPMEHEGTKVGFVWTIPQRYWDPAVTKCFYCKSLL